MSVKLGQCFLININKIKKIFFLLNLKKNDFVLEIGPGYGSITKYLLRISKVCFVELEESIFNYLEENISYFSTKISINDNIFNIFIEKLFLLNNRKKIRIFSNLPYYISKQILKLFIKKKKYIQDMNITLQKEIGDQLISKKNINTYTSNTILYQYWFKINNYLSISNKCFFPIPKIESSFLIFEPFIILPVFTKQYENFLYIINIVFKKKKKKLILLIKILNNINKDIFNYIKDLRCINLTICDFCYLSKYVLPKGRIELPTRGSSIHCSTN